MNGELVGILHRASNRTLSFEYAEAWLLASHATPISLSMPLSTTRYRDSTVSNFFDNLLPDDSAVRRRLQSHVGAKSDQPFDLLAGIGGDCIGALQLFETSDLPTVKQVQATQVSDVEIGVILRTLGRDPLGIKPTPDRFRISLAGVHDKTALLRLNGRWHRPKGPTPTSHILKLPIGRLGQGSVDLSDSVENEWLCLQILGAFGLAVPSATIHSFDGVLALVVERFDRKWSSDRSWLVRLPHEDVCQALGVSAGQKYESDGGPGIVDTMNLLLQSATPEVDRADFFKATLLYWMLGATDGHAKNFSLSLRAGGGCNLAPFYDVVSAYPAVARKQLHASELKVAMSVPGSTGKQYGWERIQRRHWMAMAKASRFPTSDAEGILSDCVSRAKQTAHAVEAALPQDFPETVATPILRGLERAAKRLG